MQDKYIAGEQVVCSRLGADMVALNPDTGKYLALNPVAAVIFEMFEQPHSTEEVVDKLIARFDVSRDQCTEETSACIRKMLDLGLLTAC